jgi:UDP-glucose 4-epimerase
MKGNPVLVTGGAGFIGSHLVDDLMLRQINVVVLDNLSNGSLKNLERWNRNRNFTFLHKDLLNLEDAVNAAKGLETVFHLAANPEVRTGTTNPEAHFRQNIQATFNLLEAVRKAGSVNMLIFTSSSTVYGEPRGTPTPEDYAPLQPISVYGASKLSCEALVIAYAYTYGFKAVIYRLANITGPRSTHGVVYDFVQKLKKNSRELEVLGSGSQKKSYLLVDDCMEAMRVGLEKAEDQVEIYNIGSEDQIAVNTIANIVIEEMGLKDVRLRFTGGVDGGRGWIGDVKSMLLDISRLSSTGWNPKYSSEESVRLTVRKLLSKGR